MPVAVAYVGVGGNLAPETNIAAALELLARELRVTGISTFYRCEAVGRPEQPPFLNGACRVETDLEPRALKFDVMRAVEARVGRSRSVDKFAPRTVDLDVLWFADRVVEEDGLSLPDPDIRTRPFVAVPLLELAPDLVFPDTGERLADLPVVRDVEGLEADAAFTRSLRMRLFHES